MLSRALARARPRRPAPAVLLVAALAAAALAAPASALDGTLPNADKIRLYKLAPGGRTAAIQGAGPFVLTPRFSAPVSLHGRVGFSPSGRGLKGAVVQVVSPTNSVITAALTTRGGNFVVRWRARENGPHGILVAGTPLERFVTVRLRPRVTITRHRTRAHPGESILVLGQVRPAYAAANRSVRLQVRQAPSGGWRTQGNGPVGPDGRFALRYVASGGGRRTLALRIITPRTADGWASGSSKAVALVVR